MSENNLNEFTYLLFSLKDKVHENWYQVDKRFFDAFENSPIEDGTFEVKITLNKSESLLQFKFDIQGVARLTCDRSLEEFDYPLDKTSNVVFKFGEAYDEPTDDLIVLEQGTSELNVSRWVYELIAVEIPFKKLHPKFQEEEGEFDFEEDDNLELVYSDQSEEEESEDSTDQEVSWEELKKKFNKE